MKKALEIIYAYIKTLEDFDELQSLKLLKKHSNHKVKVYRLSYLDQNTEKQVLRLELNQKKEKLSFGFWDNNAMQTIKYKQFMSK